MTAISRFGRMRVNVIMTSHEDDIGHVLEQLVGDICCVTEPINGKKTGMVRCWGNDFPAISEKNVKKGQWVRVIDHTEKELSVDPLNVWLGSCGCN